MSLTTAAGFLALAVDPSQNGGHIGAEDPWFALLPWIEMAALVVVAALLVVALRVHQRLAELADVLRAQGARLDQVAAQKTGAAAARGETDLRRLEHLLIDLRDGQAKLAAALLDKGSARAGETAAAAPGLDPAEALLERVHNRLYALGYDRVQLLGERTELAALVAGRGALSVEARKNGILHKGRVQIHAGRILDVEMRPPYAMFP